MTAAFRGREGRHLVVYGDAKVPGRFVGVSVEVDKESGGVQGVELVIDDFPDATDRKRVQRRRRGTSVTAFARSVVYRFERDMD